MFAMDLIRNGQRLLNRVTSFVPPPAALDAEPRKRVLLVHAHPCPDSYSAALLLRSGAPPPCIQRHGCHGWWALLCWSQDRVQNVTFKEFFRIMVKNSLRNHCAGPPRRRRRPLMLRLSPPGTGL